MMTRITGFNLVAALCLIGGCMRPATGPKKSGDPPAKVVHVVSEGQLNTIELTPAAVKRLGIETVPVQMRSMPRVSLGRR